jgi:hypothetical protein
MNLRVSLIRTPNVRLENQHITQELGYITTYKLAYPITPLEPEN